MEDLLPDNRINTNNIVKYVENYIGEDNRKRFRCHIGVLENNYIYPFLSKNRFSMNKIKIQPEWKKENLSKFHIKECFYKKGLEYLERDNEHIQRIRVENENAQNIYYTHNNGAREFAVYVHDDKVNIYKLSDKHYYIKYLNNQDYYIEHVATYYYDKIFIGTSPLNDTTQFSGGHGSYFDGNSMLLALNDNTYVFIGTALYEFTMDDEIMEYFSPVGNSDVPYPFAIGKKNVYFMLDCTYMPKEIYDEYVPEGCTDAYNYYYEFTSWYHRSVKGNNFEKSVTKFDINNILYPNYCSDINQ
jgi:hypothetical protein